MIYLDTSVVLAQLLAEDRIPPPRLWGEPLVSSRLIEYEVWNRLHARGLGVSHGDHARALLARVTMVEPVSPALARALEPFPVAVRTLDALHLASIAFLQIQSQQVALASYDDRMLAVARALGIALYLGTEETVSGLPE